MNMFYLCLIAFVIAFVIAFTIWSVALELCAIKTVLKEIRDKLKGE